MLAKITLQYEYEHILEATEAAVAKLKELSLTGQEYDLTEIALQVMEVMQDRLPDIALKCTENNGYKLCNHDVPVIMIEKVGEDAGVYKH